MVREPRLYDAVALQLASHVVNVESEATEEDAVEVTGVIPSW
jgi:hypothetical protein